MNIDSSSHIVDLWQEVIRNQELGNEQENDLISKIRFGIGINFDIHDYFKGHIQLNHKTGCFESLWGNKVISRKEIYTELDRREQLMMKVISQRRGKEPIKGD